MRAVAVAGFAPDSRDLINAEPDTTEIWGLNNAHVFLKKKASRWFQIHPPDWKADLGLPPGEYGRPPGHVKFLSEFEGPVYMLAPDKRIPNSVAYPIDEIKAHFGLEYFTSSMAYMLALALYDHDVREKVDEIKVFGVNLTTSAEYFEQKACLEYWLGVAKGKGIKTSLPPTTALLRGPLYARPVNDLIGMSKARVEQWRKEFIQNRDRVIWLMAAFQELKPILEAIENEPGKVRVKQRMDQLYMKSQEHVQGMNGSLGSMREAQHMLISLGGFDVTAMEVWPISIPDRPFAIPEAFGKERSDGIVPAEKPKDTSAGTGVLAPT